MNPLLEAALGYAVRGLRVLPLVPGEKRPLSAHGVKDATTDAGQIRSWWTNTPDANIGIATGKVSGLTVLDVDTKPGKNGYASLEALELSGVTPMQMTQSGGMQYFFAYDPAVGNSVGKIGEGLDTKGDGGYVVAPPSQVNGNPYTWLVPFTTPLAPMPAAILEKLKADAPMNGKRSTEEWQRTLKGVGEGSRQSELVRVAGKYYGSALDPVLARQSVHAWNAQNNPPLSREEVDACCDRIEQKEEAKGSTADVMPLTAVDMAPVP